MRKKLMNNWSLKVLSVLTAVVLWAVIVNISNPIDYITLYADVEILNGEVLNRAGTAYEIIGSQKVRVNIYSRKTDSKNISVDDIRLTADLNTLWPANGTIKIQTEIVNNANIIEKVETQVDTLQVKTENLQVKEFDVILHAAGNPADGYVIGSYDINPGTVTIKGPESVIGQINSIGIPVDISGAVAGITDLAALQLYDANGNVLTGLDEKLTFSSHEFQYSITILKAKKVSLDFTVHGRPADGYRYLGFESSISSIMVAGASELISGLDHITISVDALSVSGATADVSVAINLQDYIPAGVSVVNMTNLNTEVTLRVEALLQKTIIVKPDQIDLLNKDSDYTYEAAFPDGLETQVVVEGLKKDLDNLDESNILPYLDVKNMRPGVSEHQILFQLPEEYRVVNAPRVIITILDMNQTAGPSETTGETVAEAEESDGETTEEISNNP